MIHLTKPAAAFNLDVAVGTLLALAANKRATRPLPQLDDAQPIAATLYRITDFAEPSPEWSEAHQALQVFAGELASVGGVDRMVQVYDEAVERHGYHAVQGVSASWDGCHGWWH